MAGVTHKVNVLKALIFHPEAHEVCIESKKGNFTLAATGTGRTKKAAIAEAESIAKMFGIDITKGVN